MSFVLGLQKSIPLPMGVLIIACVGAFALCFLLSLGGCKELYLSAFFFLTAVGCFGAYISTEGGGEAAAVTAFLFSALFGATYPCLCLFIFLRRRQVEKRLQRKRQAEEAQFVLPDKRNDFLRDRLQTRLCKAQEEEIRTAEAFQLTFVKKTIEKLQSAALSPAERLDVERIAQELEKYAAQTTVTGGQLREINDGFSKVLKLAAKYAV